MTSTHDAFDARDEDLLRELGRLIHRMGGSLAEPPAEQRDIAKELFVWRTVDAELAELTGDSLLDAHPHGRRTRARAQPRLLTFEVDGLSIEAEVDVGPSGRRLIGQIVPAGAADVRLQSEQAQAQTEADDRGRFVLPLPVHEVRMRLRFAAGDRTVETAWVLV